VPKKPDLAALGIGDVEAVLAEAGGGVPEAVAHRQPLAVFREDDARREREAEGVVRDQGVEIAIDDAFKAGPIAR
jgi:hypothetical protein